MKWSWKGKTKWPVMLCRFKDMVETWKTGETLPLWPITTSWATVTKINVLEVRSWEKRDQFQWPLQLLPQVSWRVMMHSPSPKRALWLQFVIMMISHLEHMLIPKGVLKVQRDIWLQWRKSWMMRDNLF